MMTATYSPEDNKLRLYSSSRLDAETYARVKAAGFSWAPKQELFVAPMWTPARADLLEELCGEIGDEDTSLVDRAEQRADRFDDYSDKRTADAHSAHRAVAAIADNIPLGQPILVGHHSERHARREAERIENGMRRAVKMWETAGYWKSRAAGALQHAKYKERPDVRARRIKGLESDLRKQVKQIKQAEDFTRLWTREGLTPERAKAIANYDHINVREEGGDKWGTTLWSLLDRGQITAERAAEHAVQAHTRSIASARRWADHIANRLEYERAMLAESGWTPPPKPKTKADLPLLNYPGEVAYRNQWRAGEIIRAQAVPMTKAELAAIDSEYKGTRVSECGTHRIRIAHRRAGEYVAVFLTDSKTHGRPGTDAVAAKAADEEMSRDALVTQQLVAAQARAAAPRPAPDPQAAPFKAMKESLRAGVQVVTANQLFPTPDATAARMAQLANVRPGMRVLEPSAGTGAILRAIDKARGYVDEREPPCEVVAVEVNPTLTRSLDAAGLCARVVSADFLDCNGDLGKFDRIIMNPPFERGADIAHILHARAMLKPGGRLVAICANGPRQAEKLKPLAATWEELPEGTFAGTGVRTVLLSIEG